MTPIPDNTIPSRSELIAGFNKPDAKKAAWQLTNSLLPYFALNYLMYLSLSWSYWITLALAIPAAAFLTRVFIIFHDCGHGSYFKSMKWNKAMGFFLGLFSYTSYHQWQRTHSIHHGTVGNLDKRGVGDVNTLTLQEFRALSPWRRFMYKFYRHPLFLFTIAPALLFLVQNRWPSKALNRQEKWGVMYTNLALAILIVGFGLLIGFKAVLLIQLPIMFFAGIAGVWLFYVQHQFEDTVWMRQDEWDYREAALKGSSYLKLPRVLQWFSGNIGFHHVHHIGPRIPNYNLEACHKKHEVFRNVKPLDFLGSMRTVRLRVWDEEQKRLVSLRHA